MEQCDISGFLRSTLLCCLILAAGCHIVDPGTPEPSQQDTSYRTPGGYYRQEMARLMAQGLQIRKVVRINGQQDSAMVTDSTALEALFRPLMDADVSKPSLADGYRTDTIANQFSSDTTFIIRSLGKQTWPYQLIVDVDNRGRIKTAQVSSHTRNLMYRYEQEVFYERNKALRVSTFQQIIFMKPEHMEVEALFYPSTYKI